MYTRKELTKRIGLMVVAIGFAVPVFAQGSADGSSPGAEIDEQEVFASAVLRIDVGTTGARIDDELVGTLLSSTPIKRSLAKAAGMRPQVFDEEVMMSVYPLGRLYAGDQQRRVALGIEFTCSNRDVYEKTLAMLDQLPVILQGALRTTIGDAPAELERRLESVVQEIDRSEAEMRELQELASTYRERSGMYDLDADRVRRLMSDYQEELRGIERAMVELTAQQRALAGLIAETSERIERGASESEVVQNLERIVGLRERRIEFMRAQVENGVISPNEVMGAEEDLARARAELARAVAEVAQKSGGGTLQQMTQQLNQIAMQAAEHEARQGWVRQQLAEWQERNVMEIAEEYEQRVRHGLRMLERPLMDLRAEKRKQEMLLRQAQAVEVVLIGG